MARKRAPRDHVAEIVGTFGFRAHDGATYRELSRWLLPVANGADQGEALLDALLDEMWRRARTTAATWGDARRSCKRISPRSDVS